MIRGREDAYTITELNSAIRYVAENQQERKMSADHWTITFTIVVNGIQVDFTELPEQYRIQILMGLFAGETNGTLDSKEHLEYGNAVS